MTRKRVPEGAVFEADLGEDPFGRRWALYDVSGILPVNKKRGNYPTRQESVGATPKHMDRPITEADIQIIRVYNHHSGAMGKDGFDGFKASVGYSTRDKKKKRKIKSGPNKGEMREVIEQGWPGGPYTFWNCYKADQDADGRLVIYRGNPDELRTYHTGQKANDHGVGLAWQGNLTSVKPSKDQLGGATVLNAYCLVRYDLAMDNKPFSWHAESPEFGGKAKPTCPGPHVEAFVAEYRDKLVSIDVSDDEADPVVARPPAPPAPPAVAAAPLRRNRHPLGRG